MKNPRSSAKIRVLILVFSHQKPLCPARVLAHTWQREQLTEQSTVLHKYANRRYAKLDNMPSVEYITLMEWQVLLDTDFKVWLLEQGEDVQTTLFAHIGLLKTFGPGLGRPHVDTLKGSSLPNLKELRVQHQGEPWRVLFVFDPKRRAIVLVGENKGGDKRWYKKAISLAEHRYQRHLKQMEHDDDRNP